VTASLGDLTQIPISTRPTQGLPRLGDVSVTLYNQDLTNVVYASYQQWFAPGQGNSIPIQPLGSITISAAKAIYVGSLVSGVLPLLVLPQGSNIQPSPAQIAAQINALGLAKETTQLSQTSGATIATDIAAAGTPPLIRKQVLAQASNATISTAGSTTIGPFTFTQPSYDFTIISTSVVATVTYLSVIFTWTDSASGFVVGRETYWMFPATSTSGQPHTVCGKGPSKADTLSVQFTASTNNVTVSYALMQTSKTFGRDYWATVTPLTSGTVFASGLPTVTMDPSGLFLASMSDALGIGASIAYTMPLYVGQVALMSGSSSSAADGVVNILDQSSGAGALPKTPFVVRGLTNLGSGIGYQPNVALPRAQCNIQSTNNNAAGKTLTATVCAQEVQVS
jgi:hypothetical protein